MFGGAIAGLIATSPGAKLRQLKAPVPVWGPHHHDVDLGPFESVDAVHPGAFDRHGAFNRHAEGGEEGMRLGGRRRRR